MQRILILQTLIVSIGLFSCSNEQKKTSKKMESIQSEDDSNQGALSTNKSKTSYLFLHGLLSNAATWDVVAERLFENNCPVIEDGQTLGDLSKSKCFRYNFLTRVDNNHNT